MIKRKTKTESKMKKSIHIIYTTCIGFVFCMTGCGQEDTVQKETEPDNIMKFQIIHPSQQSKSVLRATETAFETNDQIGLFVTGQDEPLQIAGNYVNNASLTYNGEAWIPAKPIYWNDGTYDVYAYYPHFSPILSVDETEFNVALDQSTTKTANTLGGYEASDFLWASTKKQTAGNAAVPLKFRHCMSKLIVRLIKGEDYEGDLAEDATVYIHNTVPSATIDLSVGVATKALYGTEASIKAKPAGDHRYTAILVPQRIDNRRPLIEVVMKGVSYLMESKFLFKPGIQHTISLTISKNPDQVKIEIGGEVEDWEPTQES